MAKKKVKEKSVKPQKQVIPEVKEQVKQEEKPQQEETKVETQSEDQAEKPSTTRNRFPHRKQ